MKLFLLSLFLLLSLHADKTDKITLGIGSYFQTQPYKDVDTIFIPSPVIFYENSIFYIRWSRVGAYFLGSKNDELSWGFSLTALPRFYGYERSDIRGMDERKDSWEGGVSFSASKETFYLEMMLLTDLLDNHDSWNIKTEFGQELHFGKLSLYPSIFAIYQSSKFMDYYYGVTPAEAIKRAEIAYKAKAGWQIGIQTYIKYPLTKNISAFLNLKADKLPSSATRSTIVEDKYIYSGLASLIYTFDY